MEILIAQIVKRKFHPVRRLPKQKIIAGTRERSQKKQPVKRKVKKHLHAVSAAIQKRKK